MNIKETLDQIKGLFKSEKNTFVETKGEDGTLYSIEGEIVVGANINVINEDGTLTPATDGEAVIEGVTIVIKDGKIEEIKNETIAVNPENGEEAKTVEELAEVEDVTEDETETEKTEAPNDEKITVLEEKITVIEEKITMIEQAINEIVSLIQQQMANFSTVKEKVEKFEQTPATEPITKRTPKFLETKTESSKFSTKWTSQLKNK